MQQSCSNGVHILLRDCLLLLLLQVACCVAVVMLGGIVHWDGDGDAGDVGKAVAGVLMVMGLEHVVHDELQANTRIRSHARQR